MEVLNESSPVVISFLISLAYIIGIYGDSQMKEAIKM